MRQALLRFLALVLIVSMTASFLPSSAQADPSTGDTENSEPALLDPKSNPLAIVFDAFLKTGYSADQASALAQQALGYPMPNVDMTVSQAAGVVLMDPKSNALAMVYDAFLESGHAPDAAAEIAIQALGLQPTLMCAVYRINITYCAGGNEIQFRGLINARCWEDPDGIPTTPDGLNQCLLPACVDGYNWLSLASNGSCTKLGVPNGTCVAIHVYGTSFSMPCDEIDIECSCFGETTGGPINCAAIEACCCPSQTTGCTGCPACTPPACP